MGYQRHIAEFISLRCAPDILSSGIFKSRTAKEITESMCAYSAVRDWLDPVFSDRSCTLVSVGDGSTPRTASMFAFRSGWRCISVDPALKRLEWSVDRLTCHPCKVADMPWDEEALTGDVYIVCVHSHAPMADVLERITVPTGIQRHIVTMPCCFDLNLADRTPDKEYEDPACWSEKRTVQVWKNV